MKPGLLVTLLATAAIVTSCSRFDRADYIAVCRDGFSKLEVAKLLDQQYPEVDHFIIHSGLGKQPSEWQTVAFIHGRFVLTYEAPVNVDYKNLSATPSGDGRFYLWAASTIRILDGDRAETTYDANLQREFGMKEWLLLVRSGFDLTALGIPQNEIRPIPNWKVHVHVSRKDRVSIK